MPVLLCAAKGKRGGCWAAVPETLDLQDKGGDEAGNGNSGSTQGLQFAGAVCPVLITAKEVSITIYVLEGGVVMVTGRMTVRGFGTNVPHMSIHNNSGTKRIGFSSTRKALLAPSTRCSA